MNKIEQLKELFEDQTIQYVFENWVDQKVTYKVNELSNDLHDKFYDLKKQIDAIKWSHDEMNKVGIFLKLDKLIESLKKL